MYVGVVGASARISEVCRVRSFHFIQLAGNTLGERRDAYSKVIAHPMRDFRERIGGTRRDEDDVRPAAELDV
jgi:hypothetical protein